MSGIRVEVDRLAVSAEALRAAGAEFEAAGRAMADVPAGPAWAEGALEPCERLAAVLGERIFGTAHAVLGSGAELAAVVERHAAEDERHAADLARGEGS
ncbi:hypothetical protein ACL03H_05430 [Saccharopolyspora sp. MS10]|uniref:hypothetical protein n=1 Tax=Saccharopolyspora sp. MS10 TaxID=3385973 RepID=UPI0039A2019C